MGIKIFIVEDHKDLRLFYKIALTNAGYEVIGKVSNGLQALEVLRSHTDIDLIIMDHRFPYKDGLFIAKEIFRLIPTVKILFVSSDLRIKREAIELGVTGFLEKPFGVEELLLAVKDAITNQPTEIYI